MKSKPILNITADSFDKYGTVLEFSKDFDGVFEIIIKQPDSGWRLALLRHSGKTGRVMECHPRSMETFEPLSGILLIIVAPHDRPLDFEVFLLDKPVCLHAGVWHQVISLAAESQVKIAENYQVESEYFELESDISAALIYE
jgi:ureidoglycolate hydrolase